MNRFHSCSAIAVFLVAMTVPAQVTIVKGVAPSGLVRCMNNNNNSIAFTPDGNMWTVVYAADKAGTNGHLELRQSADQGATWAKAFALPNNTAHNNHHSNSGCIVAGRKGYRLHVTWADKTANASYWSAMYQAFSTKTLQWMGTPQVLAKGYGANNQFWPVDIAMTPKGTLAVCVSGHRSGGLGLGSWDCGLAIRKPGGTFNTTLYNLRSGGASYSQNASCVAMDEKIHCTMKNATGGYGICYRSYDTETDKWDQTTQVAVGPNANASIAAGNKSMIATDHDGGLYVLYVTGNATAKRTLRLAYAAPGKGSVNGDWKDIQVIPHTATVGTNHRSVASSAYGYPIIQGGNTNYYNYALAQGPGKSMVVVYSKAFETFANLYFRTYQAGVAGVPEIKLSPAGSKPYSYEWITGLRNGDFASAAAWLVYGKTDAPSPYNGTYPNGQVDYWSLGSSAARSIGFATGCQGKLPQRPRIHAHDSLPVLGSNLKVTLDRFPASAGLFLAVGPQILSPTLNLSFMNAAECELNTDFPLIVGLSVPASGTLTVPWTVPNDNNLIGVRANVQCLVLAPGATAGGVVTTNALAFVFGK